MKKTGMAKSITSRLISVKLCANFILGIAIGCGPMLCSATTIGLGSADQYTVFALDQSYSFMGSDLTMVNGNMAIGPNSKGLLQQGTITGTLFIDPTNYPLSPATVDVLNGAVTQQRDLTQAVLDAVNASTAFATLPTNRLDVTALTGATTIIADPGDNIFNLTGGVNLSNSMVTLQGSASDYFIFNLPSTANIFFDTSNINLVGGVIPNHILFNVTGSNPGNAVTLQNMGNFRGTILAPNRAIHVSQLNIAGMLIGGRDSTFSGLDANTADISLSSGVQVQCGQFQPQVVPEPVSFLAVAPLSSLALLLRRRR